jgi:ribulose-5-phosphate 4-epimerase/fuculose-1-phosphate aldolase
LSSLAYHDYEGVALRDDEKPRLVRDLGDKTYLMLRNHGLLTVGGTVGDAWLNMYMFETVCNIQVRAMTGGSELTKVDPKIIESAQAQAKQATNGVGAGALTWPGLLRRLGRIDPSYAT